MKNPSCSPQHMTNNGCYRSGRGNIFLDSALPLTKSLHRDIVSLGGRIEDMATDIEHTDASVPQERRQVNKIVIDIKELLGRIDREIPLLQLAITASGESLSSSLPPGISPSRLLQASTLLTFGDAQFHQQPDQVVQIGPEFCLSLYMLFLGHAPSSEQTSPGQDPSASRPSKGEGPYGTEEGDRKPIWQEIIHKARVRLCRAACLPSVKRAELPLEYSYHLDVMEDKHDGRVHEASDADPGLGGNFWSRKQRPQAQRSSGISERIPVHQISKIFYTDSGRLLNIGDETQDGKNPVLLLKRDTNSPASQEDELFQYRNDHQACDPEVPTEEEDTQAELDRQLLGDQAPRDPLPEVHLEVGGNGFPKHLDPEWIAMEMYEDSADDDESSSEASEASEASHSDQGRTREEIAYSEPYLKSPCGGRDRNPKSELESKIRNLPLRSTMDAENKPSEAPPNASTTARSPFGHITTSLSLIEMLIRLAGLQEFQQASHLTIPDHILTFFLEETSTTGLVGEAQWRARKEAQTRVGFDPYSDHQ